MPSLELYLSIFCLTSQISRYSLDRDRWGWMTPATFLHNTKCSQSLSGTALIALFSACKSQRTWADSHLPACERGISQLLGASLSCLDFHNSQSMLLILLLINPPSIPINLTCLQLNSATHRNLMKTRRCISGAFLSLLQHKCFTGTALINGLG